MKNITIRHEYIALEVNTTKNNTSIKDSFLIRSYNAMKSILKKIRIESSKNMAIHKRSMSSMIHLWRVYNILYTLGIQRSKTSTVNLDLHISNWKKVAYFFVSLFYFHFY